MWTKQLSSAQIIILGFLGIILLGSLLLSLPFATRDHTGANYFDALFTSVSAVCVTGLVVQDTGTYWSGFGQAVILGLIQIGGLGVVASAWTLLFLSGRKISLKQRSTMQEAISANHVGGIVRLTGFFLRVVLIMELLGAVLLYPAFCKDFGWIKGLWMSLFHSVSAFCNAGFDLMGGYRSLTGYQANPWVSLIVPALIILGGLGFLTWEDVRTNKLRLKNYRMQSKVIFSVTLGLLLVPALLFFFLEFREFPVGQRLLLSWFQAVTPRTAGFNTADLTRMSPSGQGLTILLMLIGGAPGSTAGGMKVTTAAVLISTAWSVFSRREHTQFFGRRISDQTVRTASTIGTMYLVLFFFSALVICRMEHLPLLSCLFETASAIGTVGLTLGLTPSLGMVSRGILMILMFFGRVGGLTLIYAALSGTRGNTARLPQEKLTVG